MALQSLMCFSFSLNSLHLLKYTIDITCAFIKRKDIVCVIVGDDSCAEHAIRMNIVVRSNVTVRLGDVVSIHQCPKIKYGKHVHILPIDDTIEGLTGDMFDAYLERECLVPTTTTSLLFLYVPRCHFLVY